MGWGALLKDLLLGGGVLNDSNIGNNNKSAKNIEKPNHSKKSKNVAKSKSGSAIGTNYDFSGVKQINVINNPTLTVPYQLSEDKTTAVLNGAILGDETIEQFMNQLPANVEHNDVVTEDDGLHNLKTVGDNLESDKYQTQYNTFKGLVPKEDLPILSVAIMISISSANEDRARVAQLKSDVVQRFGVRANMICNLYKAGYFDTVLLPMKELMDQNVISPQEFSDAYETMVTESPTAVFVGRAVTYDKIKQILLCKVNKNKDNDINYLNIHGIGTENIATINRLLDDKEINECFTGEPRVNTDGVFAKVTIYF